MIINFKVSYFYLILLSITLTILPLHKSKNDQRYDLIENLLRKYQRPVTILEVNARKPEFVFKFVQNYPDSVCVITAKDQEILTQCKLKKFNNIILLNQLFTTPDLLHLSECEHFDLTINLNDLEESDLLWQEKLNAILKTGDHIIIEVPANNYNIASYLVSLAAQVLGEISNKQNQTASTLYLLTPNNKILKRKTWLRLVMPNSLYQIESSFTHKNLIKPAVLPRNTLQKSPWIAGINLCTFKMCYGTYPTTKQLKACLQDIKDIYHSDWLINNMILQGNKITLIDCDDASCKSFFSQELLRAHEQILELNDPEKINHFFWHKLIKVPATRRQFIKLFGQLFQSFSLIFDLNFNKASHETLLDCYLGYGSKVICCQPTFSNQMTFNTKYKQENLFSTTEINIDKLIYMHGIPKFCNIHAPVDTAYQILKTLTQQIECIALPFDLNNQVSLLTCLEYLTKLGYTEFNFSVREIPVLILQNNPYINLHKTWASSSTNLLEELRNFVKLDYDGNNLWGYIYAKIN